MSHMVIMLVMSVIRQPGVSFEGVHQLVLKDRSERDKVMKNFDQYSIVFVYLDKEDRKLCSWLNDNAHALAHKEFIFCHSSWNSTCRKTPHFLKHIPGLTTYNYPTCATGAGPCNQLHRITTNSINLKDIRRCTCKRKVLADGCVTVSAVIKLVSWYRDTLLAAGDAMLEEMDHASPNRTTQQKHDLYQIQTKTKTITCNHEQHRCLIGGNDITATVQALRALCDSHSGGTFSEGVTNSYPTDAAEKKRDAKRAAKAAGKEIKVKERPKHIHDHFDDC